MHRQLADLADLALRHARGRVTETPLPGVRIATTGTPTPPTPGLYAPMHCLVVQGAKEVAIGDVTVRYDPASYFVAALDLPAVGRVVEASPEKPYIVLGLALDRETVAELLAALPVAPEPAAPGFAVSPVTEGLLDAWLRLLRLLDTPDDIKVLGPLVERELLYRLLQGPQGSSLGQLARGEGRIARVRSAIDWIRANFDRPLRVDDLARLAGMSAASFHRHFKAATAMSPLQYQKRLRLQEARRLLVGDRDAARAGYAVGYESASQFSREYARLFGRPPARDAAHLRGDGTVQDEAAA